MKRHDELAMIAARGHAMLLALDILTPDEILAVQAEAETMSFEDIEALYASEVAETQL